MSEFEELWLVDSVEDTNKLMKVGWKFIQIVNEEQKLYQEGWISSKVIGTRKILKYLIGKPNGILSRKNRLESVNEYIERVGENQK